MPPAPPVQLPVPPAQLIIPTAQHIVPPAQPALIPQLMWSYFKPESADKPDEDVKALLLKTNDWMDTQGL